MYTEESATDQITAVSGGQPKVAILMGTYNGERFLKEQLDSIAAQTHSNWELHVSDDGSTDNTLAILDTTTSSWLHHKTTVRAGPRKGFVANFLSLACDPEIEADYYAFSDQDDVWENDKLARALEWLQTVAPHTPALYCSRTRLIDEKGQTIGFSPLFRRKPSFRNALVQSIAGANSMVFNKAARKLLLMSDYQTPVVSHDWWVYMLVTGCSGEVFYDPRPSIGYRQHEQNLVGSNVGWRSRYVRIMASFRGRFTEWNDMNIAALLGLKDCLSSESRTTLKHFVHLRSASPFNRLNGLTATGLYRQTTPGNISLFVATLLGKI